MPASLPAELSCPACFKRLGSEASACPTCDAAVWVDGRLALVGPLEEGRPGMFRGLLRGEGGALQEVAVKVLDVGGLPNWRDYDRFRRQNEILGSLSHPRIPRARGEFEVGARVLQCQTLIAGRNLARQLRGARLTPPEATRLAIDLLEILDYLHGRDVVHRDVKPDNVVIGADGGAHLVDFGAARRLHETADRIDPEPTVVGTPGYMPPEQTRGEAVAQSDLYALGRLLGEALAGAQPEPALASLLPLLTREDWRKRPASAADALARLRPILRDPWPRRWPALVVVSVLVAIPVLVRMQVKHGRTVAPKVTATAAIEPAAAPAGPSLEEQARALLYEWSLAQQQRDMARYARCYAPDFKGVRRTPGGKVLNLDRDEWLKDRARIMSEPVEVQITVGLLHADEADGTVTMSLVQRFRRGAYAEHGDKQLVARRVGGALLLTSEQMLNSKRGWDDDEVSAICEVNSGD